MNLFDGVLVAVVLCLRFLLMEGSVYQCVLPQDFKRILSLGGGGGGGTPLYGLYKYKYVRSQRV